MIFTIPPIDGPIHQFRKIFFSLSDQKFSSCNDKKNIRGKIKQQKEMNINNILMQVMRLTQNKQIQYCSMVMLLGKITFRYSLLQTFQIILCSNLFTVQTSKGKVHIPIRN